MSIPVSIPERASSEGARASRPLSRRTLLAASLSPLLMAACGGGGDDNAAAKARTLSVETTARAQAAAAAGTALGLAGLAVGRLTDDRLELGVAGRRRVDGSTALSGDELFCLGSNAKAMTALIAARLVELGRLRWDSRLLDVEPALRAATLPVYAGITLEQLLAHRSGVWALTQDEELEALYELVDAPLPETLAALRLYLAGLVLGLPPQDGVQPGQGFHYSNAGYLLAGLMLERASGDSFERLLERHVAGALEIPADLRAPAVVDPKRQPWGHAGAAGALVPLTAVPAERLLYIDATAAAGVAAMTPRGYARWLHLHLRALRGESTPLPALYVQRLRAATEGDYVLGWSCARDQGGRLVLAHIGAEHGFTTMAQLDAGGRDARFALSNTQVTGWVLEAMQAGLERLG